MRAALHCDLRCPQHRCSAICLFGSAPTPLCTRDQSCPADTRVIRSAPVPPGGTAIAEFRSAATRWRSSSKTQGDFDGKVFSRVVAGRSRRVADHRLPHHAPVGRTFGRPAEARRLRMIESRLSTRVTSPLRTRTAVVRGSSAVCRETWSRRNPAFLAGFARRPTFARSEANMASPGGFEPPLPP